MEVDLWCTSVQNNNGRDRSIHLRCIRQMSQSLNGSNAFLRRHISDGEGIVQIKREYLRGSWMSWRLRHTLMATIEASPCLDYPHWMPLAFQPLEISRSDVL